jgi:hypothetical protein
MGGQGGGGCAGAGGCFARNLLEPSRAHGAGAARAEGGGTGLPA